jgi:hypothetical protein
MYHSSSVTEIGVTVPLLLDGVLDRLERLDGAWDNVDLCLRLRVSISGEGSDSDGASTDIFASLAQGPAAFIGCPKLDHLLLVLLPLLHLAQRLRHPFADLIHAITPDVNSRLFQLTLHLASILDLFPIHEEHARILRQAEVCVWYGTEGDIGRAADIEQPRDGRERGEEVDPIRTISALRQGFSDTVEFRCCGFAGKVHGVRDQGASGARRRGMSSVNEISGDRDKLGGGSAIGELGSDVLYETYLSAQGGTDADGPRTREWDGRIHSL